MRRTLQSVLGMRVAAAVAATAVSLLAGSAVGAAPPPAAQTAPDRSAWESGLHVVRPGDTLEGLAERFLGSSQLWRELHTLNPWVKDPDLLYPGQRLRVFLDLPTPEPSAQVVETSRRVSELPRPRPWQPAENGDVLLEKDGLRTERSSSARLRFDDGATVTVSEDSLVFIRRQTRASAPAPKKEIEIQVGQADVEASRTASDPGSIEIVVGAARASGRSVDGAPLQARSRKAEGDKAQFMVYGGSSSVAAGGVAVEVGAGMGTSVAPKAKPAPPEALLPAPNGLAPGDGGELDLSAPRLAWNEVSGAAGYVVEICRDAACGSVVERITGVTGGSTTARERLDGSLYWRVTAVAPSGLDGYPSPVAGVTAVASVAPPVPVVALLTTDGRELPADSCAAAVPDLRVRAVDRAGAELQWTLLVDGAPTTLDAFRTLPLAGRHQVAARATDARGRTADSTAHALVLDGAAPWLEPQPPLAATTNAPEEKKRRSKRGRGADPSESDAGCDATVEVRDAAGAWRAVPCAAAGGSTAEPLRLALDGERAELALRTGGVAKRLGGAAFTSGEVVSLGAWDVGCGLAEVAFRVRPAVFSTGSELEAVVTDRAGNARTLAWRLTR